MSLTIETKVWEKDWKFMLKDRFIKRLMLRVGGAATRRVLFINNVEKPKLVAHYAAKLVADGILDNFVFVDDYATEALNFFDLTQAKLGRGYYYSIAELVSIYLCDTEYLAHFSGDSSVPCDVPEPWLGEAVNLLRKRPDVSVVNLAWDYKFREVDKDSLFSDDDFAYGYGFSDQMYVVRSAEFKGQIYDYLHPASARYPAYGGELFEKRVDSWMRVEKKLRATSRRWSYQHLNFPNRNSAQGVFWRMRHQMLRTNN
ncbi:MAG: hypothetical protein HOJ43_05440 [Betaproteobacteria bacterium]|nr:hypothetical protein [Betaproteobacteria bacterium]